jgi:hypothetical protein
MLGAAERRICDVFYCKLRSALGFRITLGFGGGLVSWGLGLGMLGLGVRVRVRVRG